MKWLHISDIHFNYKGFETINLKNKFIQKIEELSLNLDFILITGDCLYKYNANHQSQKEIADFIKSIAKKCNCSSNKVYMCQGNHDVNREDNYRNKLISEIRNGEKDFSENYDALCELGNEKFQNIYKLVTQQDYKSYKVISPRSSQFRIITINSCLLSKDKEDCGQLKVCNQKLIDIGAGIRDDDKLNILIMHHGIEFLDIDDAKKFQHWIDDHHIDIVYCGHSHKSSIDLYNDTFRDIMQITAGAILIDGYATPSFHLCECSEDLSEIYLQLYTYTTKKDDWVIDNQSLRKFKDGTHCVKLPRKLTAKIQLTENIKVIDIFNQKYKDRYNSSKIYSNKYDGNEDFNAWKIVNSLVNVGMSYNKALVLTDDIINKITDKKFETTLNILSCCELRMVVYDSITHYKPQNGESEFDVSCWSSRYARKYNRNKEIVVWNTHNEQEKLNYDYIKNILIKKVFAQITGNESYYKKVSGNELCQMAELILAFLKNMEIFEIKYSVLIDLVIEYMTQKPHPWIVNKNANTLVEYHAEQAAKHIEELNSSPVISTQVEAAYHICSIFMVKYDLYIGCNETSPIISLTNSANWLFDDEKFKNDKLPIFKHKIVQLKKDLEQSNIKFVEFQNTLNTINDNLIKNRNVTNDKSKKAILDLWNYFKKINQSTKSHIDELSDPVERIRGIFMSADGFVVKSTLQALQNCFWFEPNWDKYELAYRDMRKQILVCVLNEISDAKEIHSYFFEEKQGKPFSEIVFALSNYSSFSSEERITIRNYFKGEYVKCIFIQETNYEKISEENNWRSLFIDILNRSKIS